MDWLKPMAMRMIDANINRRTVETARRSELEIVQVAELTNGGIFQRIFVRILARQPEEATPL